MRPSRMLNQVKKIFGDGAMKYIQVCVLGMAAFFLAACGGGGGGGREAGGPVDSSLTIRSYPDIVYSGSETDATLTQSNFPRYIANFYSVVQLVVSNAVEAVDPYYREPYFLQVVLPNDSSDDSSSDDDLCESGRLDVDDRTNPATGLGLMVIQFTACVIDDTKIDGQMVYDITSWESQLVSVATSIDQLDIVVDSERLSLQGDFDLDVSLSGDYVLQGHAIMQSRLQNRVVKLDNLVINRDDNAASVHAEMRDSVDGKVIVSSEMNSNPLVFTGGNGTQGILDFAAADNHSYYEPFITGFNLTLLNPALSQFELIGSFEPHAILDWPETVNQQPRILNSAPVSVDRNAMLTLNAQNHVSDPADLLLYSFRVVNAPAGCGHQIQQRDALSVELTFPCQGEHVLEITAADGTSAPVTRLVSIDVLPLPAVFENAGEVNVGRGEQLNVALNIVNDSLDGPFGFSIGHAPRGVTISSQGVISGVPELPLYERHGNISIQAIADNGRQSSIQFDASVSDSSADLDIVPFSESCENPIWGRIDGNSSVDYVCKWGNSYLIFELVAGQRVVSHVGRNFSETSRLQTMAIQDFDGDGDVELILVYADSIRVIEPVTDVEVGTASLARFSGLSSFLDVSLYPAETAMNGFVLQAGTRFFRYSMASGSVTSTFEAGTSLVKSAGNIDADAEPEFLMEDGRLYGFGSTTRNLTSLVGSRTAFIANVTGSAAGEIILVEGNTECSFPSQLLFSIHSASNLARISQASVQNPLGADVPWCPNIVFAKAMPDATADLYLQQSFSTTLYRFVYADGVLSAARTLEFGNAQLGNSLWRLPLVQNQLVQLRENAVALTDIDTGGMEIFSFTTGSNLQSAFGPVWDGSKILANYRTSHPAVNPLGFVEFDGDNALEWGTIDPALNAPAADVLVPQLAQTDGTAVALTRNMVDATVELQSVPAGTLIGQFVGNQSTFGVDRWTVSDFDGDQEYDAFRCGISSPAGSLSWYRMNSSQPVWTTDLVVNGAQSSCVAAILVGSSFGEEQRLAVLFRIFGGGAVLVMYDFVRGGIVEVGRYPIESAALKPHSMAVLDVAGDAAEEIVVYRDATSNASGSLSRFWVISVNTGQVRTFDVAVSDPVIQKNRAPGTQHLLLAGSYGNLFESPVSSRKLFSRLYEVSASDGGIVWQSNSLVGFMTEYGYYNLDPLRGGDKALVVTSKGLHFYH